VENQAGHEEFESWHLGVGERISLWIHRDRTRDLVTDILIDLRVIDIHAELAELDLLVAELKASMRRSRHDLALAIYPWLVLAPFAAIIAILSSIAIRRDRKRLRNQLPDVAG
jgi:hypothetical protein